MCKVKVDRNDKVDAISISQYESLKREIEVANKEYQELKENELSNNNVTNPNSNNMSVLIEMAADELIPPIKKTDNDGLYPKKEKEQPEGRGRLDD